MSRRDPALPSREHGAEGAIECWVSDNGAGVPQDRLEIILDKLETDPEKEDGTGLGLAIVKTFVEAHSGKVTVETKEGVGSTLRLTHPGRAVFDMNGSKEAKPGSSQKKMCQSVALLSRQLDILPLRSS